MKNIRKNNIASLIINLTIVFFTVESVWHNFRPDIIRDPEWLGFEGIHSLRFFTVLSNIFIAIAAFLMIFYNIKNLINDSYEYPKWLISLKYIATSAIAVTFVTVALLLAPSYAIVGKGYFTLFLGNHIYTHFLTPVLAIITLVFFENSHKIEFKEALFGVVPVFLYSILYITMVVFVGEKNGGWTDFYNFTFGGHNWVIPFSAIGMLLLAFILSIFIAKWHNKYYNKANKSNIDN